MTITQALKNSAKSEDYRGFTIIVDNYKRVLGMNYDKEKSTNYFYEIGINDEILASSLYNDDKMWTIDSAIRSAKEDIDEYINNDYKSIGYFRTSKNT